MKKHNLFVLSFAISSVLLSFQPSVVSACGTCSLGRPALPPLTGQLIGNGSSANPNHAGVSFDPADPMNYSPSNVTPGNAQLASMFGLNKPNNVAIPTNSFSNMTPYDTAQLLPIVSNRIGSGFTSLVVQPSTLALGDTIMPTFASNGSGASDLDPSNFAPVGGITAVPEPAALVLLCLGLFAGVKCRRA